jgi:putative Ca2+/H+ antiporter (TMEM165/GDT1 family)
MFEIVQTVGFTASMHVMFQSLVLVGIAEMFDKTWFIALLMALKHDKYVVFTGSFLALLVHTFIAAALGIVISKFFSQGTLDFMAAAMYLTFALTCAYEWSHSSKDSDVFAAGKEDAASAIDVGAAGGKYGSDEEAVGGRSTASVPATREALGSVFGQCFIAVFIAEWGDRTQVAMVSQHASQPLMPVLVGSSAAFFVLTLSAVWVASVIDRLKLRERSVHGISAISFAVFGIIALCNGFMAMRQRHAHLPAEAGNSEHLYSIFQSNATR